MTSFDIAIVGAGMAGAGLAAALGDAARVAVLEAEDQPGRHATGRSAAFWTESYGGPAVRPLTAASGPVLRAGGYLAPRGALHVGRGEAAPRLEGLRAEFPDVEMRRVDPAALVPGLRPDWTEGLSEPSCADIDVARLHAESLAAARRAGATVMTGARLLGATRSDGRWTIVTAAGTVAATLLVNAAGAWADAVARLAGARSVGITPYRRTIVQLRTDPAVPDALPLVIDADGRFYFKPGGGGRLWLSPHDETPAAAGDAAADELDVALAIDRLQQVVDWRIAHVEHRWAGLRSFAPDRLPVYGHAPDTPGFFWCAGQGGFGIQTAPAASALAAALILGRDPALGSAIDPARFDPDRFSEPETFAR